MNHMHIPRWFRWTY